MTSRLPIRIVSAMLGGLFNTRVPIDEALVAVEKKNSSPSFSNSTHPIFLILLNFTIVKLSNMGSNARITLKNIQLILFSIT